MKRILAFLMVLSIGLSLCACSISGPANILGRFKLCDTCKLYVVGNWYWISSDNKVITVEYRMDGSIIGNNNTRWNCACTDEYHAIRIGGETYSEGITLYDPENGGFENMARDEGYTFVELTQENWQEYFSENFSQSFQIEYALLPYDRTDEWGDTSTHYVLAKYAVLKDSQRYGPLTTLMMEIDVSPSRETVSLNPEKAEFLSTQIEYHHPLEKNTMVAEYDEKENLVGFLLSCNELSNPLESEIEVYLQELGEKIYRMRGVLVIK